MAAAVGILPSNDAEPQSTSTWFYELQPADELPVLDLSQSLKSRFLSRQALDRVDHFIRQRKLIGILALTANVSYLATLLAPRSVGRVTAIVSLASWIPVSVSGVSSLRYDVIMLLVQTYDFWFLSCVNVSVFAVLGVLLGDLRAVVMVATWAGVQANIMVDANIRKVESWFFLNIAAIVVYMVTWAAIYFALIDHMQPFLLLQYQRHELPAVGFATNGLVTVIAVFARNVYRQRGFVRKQTRKTRIECVSYRTNLQFYPLVSRPKTRSRIIRILEPEYIKAMEYVQQIGLIDARNTLLCRRWLERLTTATTCWISAVHRRKLFSWLGMLALGYFGGSALYTLKQDGSHAFIQVTGHLFALTATLIYCSTCALHYHRILLLALVTSFDFVFLSAQVTTVHMCTCVFFNWEFDGMVTTLTSWIWAHWFLCLDALPPVTKRKLGITKGFAIAVVLTLTSSSCVLLYLLVFTDLGSSEMYDHVLVEMTLFGDQKVEIKLASVFFNCFATACALTTRLIWRAVTLHSNVLLVLDGIVEFENYLVGAKVRGSRRFGSLRADTKQSQARPSSPVRTVGSPTSVDLQRIVE